MTKAKKWAARIGLCLFSIVITLLLGEFAFRWKVSAWPFEKPDVDTLHRDYCHLHPQGNDIVADQITAYLLKHTNLWLGAK